MVRGEKEDVSVYYGYPRLHGGNDCLEEIKVEKICEMVEWGSGRISGRETCIWRGRDRVKYSN